MEKKKLEKFVRISSTLKALKIGEYIDISGVSKESVRTTCSRLKNEGYLFSVNSINLTCCRVTRNN